MQYSLDIFLKDIKQGRSQDKAKAILLTTGFQAEREFFLPILTVIPNQILAYCWNLC